MKPSVLLLFSLVLWIVSSAGAHAQSLEWQKIYAEVTTLRQKGQYDEALMLAKKALDVAEKEQVPDLFFIAASLNNLADLYTDQRQYAQAEPLFKRALEILEKVLEPNDFALATVRNNLGATYRKRGRYAQAEPLHESALSIQERALGPDHPDLVTSLDNLAALYETQGQYAQAESFYKRVLSIREKSLDADHPDLVASLDNLGRLYLALGSYVQAGTLLNRSLRIRKKALGPNHPDVAKSMANVAELYRVQGHFALAEPFVKRALAIFENALGPDHPDVAMSLNNLALLYRNRGYYTQAEPLFERALKIQQKSFDPFDPNNLDVAISLNNRAGLHDDQGQHAQAEPLYRRALAIFEKARGPDHPYVATGEKNIGINLWAQRDTIRAVDSLERATAIREHHLRLLLAKGSEYEKRAYMATISGDTYVAISLHLTAGDGTPGAARLALTTLLQRKGRVLDALADSFSDLRRRLSLEDVALLDQFSSVNGQRAALYTLASQGRIESGEYQSQMAGLEAEAQALETRISASSAEFRVLAQPITLERVQQAIPADAALVEFSVYEPFNPQAKTPSEKWAPARYVAYVLRPQGDPVAVDLGEAAGIERTVQDLGEGLADPGNTYVTRVARKLDEQVMRPVRKLLGETRTVLISPDGALNLVPFGALVDEDNQYLIERHAFTYLSSGRDLLRLLARVPSRYPGTIMGGVDFGSTRKGVQVAQAEPGSTNRRSAAFGNQKYLPLPWSAAEAQAIAKIFPAANLLTGRQATESALKQLDGPKILHLATHGFFLPIEREEPMEERGLQSGDGPIRAPKTENPLLRSGLALANANRLESGDEDGVLTALEATSLDLWGTQLVVLSACETGVGEVHNGEGVFGLRRALVIAGSESQVMSLWSVGDLATKDLMVDYYRRLLASEGRSEALRQAQLAMLTSKNYKHPYYWAGFIPSGSWTGLESKVPTSPVQ